MKNNSVVIKSIWNRSRFYFTILLVAFYLIISFLFLFTDSWADMIPKGRGIIGLVLFLFGAIRFYVAYVRYKNKNGVLQKIKEDRTPETKQHVTIE